MGDLLKSILDFPMLVIVAAVYVLVRFSHRFVDELASIAAKSAAPRLWSVLERALAVLSRSCDRKR